MKLTYVLPLAIAGRVASQSLAEALASQNSSLSALSTLLLSQPSLVDALNSARNITILAPNNAAVNRLTNDSATTAKLAADPGLLAALLSYHVLNGTYYASSFKDTAFIPTLLANESYANITGGQRVEAVAKDGKVTFTSGLRDASTVVTPNLNFTGGTIHIIDKVLSLPMNISSTLIASNLTAAAGAVQKANVGQTLSQARDITIFAPSNEAFNAIGSLAAGLDAQQLAAILSFHVIAGSVLYSTSLGNTSVQTLGGQNVTVTVEDDAVFVNSAKVIKADVLVSNGVVHVIDNVLNPMNATVRPNPSASSNPPAFTGASTGTAGIPFTSGIPTPTSTAPTVPAGTTSSSVGAAPMKTGAIGAAALFGGAAVLVNL